MRRLSLLLTSLTACMLCATIAHALTIGYGQNDFAEAGAGCVGGWVSDHGNIAYFRGDTELLNTHLTLLASNSVGHSLPKIVLHSGNKVIDNPEERPVTGFISVDQPTDPNPNQLAIDWSVRRYCPFNDVITGRCKCGKFPGLRPVATCSQVRNDNLGAVPHQVNVSLDRADLSWVNLWRSRGSGDRGPAVEQPNPRTAHENDQHRPGDQATDVGPPGDGTGLRDQDHDNLGQDPQSERECRGDP